MIGYVVGGVGWTIEQHGVVGGTIRMRGVCGVGFVGCDCTA